MKDNKSKLNAYKIFLVNILYHIGFNNHSIKKISCVSKDEIREVIVN